MAHISGFERGQLLLLPEAVEDYVGVDNPVRFIDAFVDRFDLVEAGFARVQPKATGRPGYAPGDLLKLHIYGYLNRVRSSRRLEAECHRNIEVIWLLRTLKPDFKNLADFRAENRAAFKSVFRQFTLLCKRLDLFGRELLAVDGTRLKAVNNKDRNFTQRSLEKFIKAVDGRLADYLQRLDEGDVAEAGTSGSRVNNLAEKIAALREKLSGPSNVLIVGNLIEKISPDPIDAPADAKLITVKGGGRTLMPGLIDAHVHIMFAAVPQLAVLTADIGFVNVAAVKEARDTLMRGFTSIRDMGGPSLGLKRGIDAGLAQGPRIWPSGAFISQSGGHGDFRLPNDFPSRPGDFSYSERVDAAQIADDPDTVRKRAREQLALGASQIKLMAGGGVSSNYDPLDVTQFSEPELRAAVEAAENWGTYVAVHAYTPRAVRQAIAAGVKSIEHGNLLDEPTVALMAEKGLWWSLQPFLDDQDATPFPAGSANRKKQLQMTSGTDNAYRLAKQYKLKTAWGTDALFDAKLATRQGAQLAKLTRWYTPTEILKMATADNAELLALSGLRSPYEGKLGVVEEGALADLLLVDGDPTQDIHLIETPDKNFLVIMKDGVFHKNIAV